MLLGALQKLYNTSAGLLDHIRRMLHPHLHTGSSNSSVSALTWLSRHQLSLQPHSAEQTDSSIWSVCSLTGLSVSSSCITQQDLAILDCSCCCSMAGKSRHQAVMQRPHHCMSSSVQCHLTPLAGHNVVSKSCKAHLLIGTTHVAIQWVIDVLPILGFAQCQLRVEFPQPAHFLAVLLRAIDCLVNGHLQAIRTSYDCSDPFRRQTGSSRPSAMHRAADLDQLEPAAADP